MARIPWDDYQQEIAPYWLRKDGYDAAWFRALGDEKDQLEYRTRESLYARFPDYAAPDALEQIGADRSLIQGPGQSESQFRAYVKDAWTIWELGGTCFGILRALRVAGYANVAILIQQGYIYTLDVNGDLVITYSGAPFSLGFPNFWNRFRVIFYPPLPPSWLPAPANIPASNSDEARYIINTINTWKAAHAILKDVVIWYSGLVWGFPVGGGATYWGASTWGGGLWNGTGAGNVWGGAGLTWGGGAVIWTP